MATLYWAQSAAFPTTAVTAVVATGTSIKTLLQVATPSTQRIKVVNWGIDLDTPASAGTVKAELVQTDVAATGGTSLTPEPYDDPNAPASLCVGGTSATCFQPSGEGTITATRIGGLKLLTPPFNYERDWPLGREFQVPVSKFLRVRVIASVTCNAYAWIMWEE